MSTTGGTEQGTLTLLEDPKRLQKKIMSAVTDSDGEIRHDPEGKPGVSGLLSLQSAVENVSIADLEARYQGRGYGDFKKDVAAGVIELLAPLQARHAELAGDPAEVERLLRRGAERALELAVPQIEAVRERIGFLPAV
jgi:tryptophanyl-tRNA synthetase